MRFLISLKEASNSPRDLLKVVKSPLKVAVGESILCAVCSTDARAKSAILRAPEATQDLINASCSSADTRKVTSLDRRFITSMCFSLIISEGSFITRVAF